MSAPIDRYRRKQLWCYRGHDVATRRPLCHCGCGQVVGPRRRSSAGPECVKAWRSHSDANHIRWVVERRDKGLCALCGADTPKLKAEWEAALIRYGEERSRGYSAEYRRQWPPDDRQVRAVWYDRADIPKPPAGFPAEDRRWWEADHIIPVVEGGGGCGPEGYRTLCVPCHRRETALLAARLAAKRRAAKQPELILA